MKEIEELMETYHEESEKEHITTQKEVDVIKTELNTKVDI
jgi:hypothetical protein